MAEVNNNALLLFQVGPVLCCAPSLRIAAIIEPQPLTHPPGASPSQPGIFKHAGHIVATRDLRYHFGVPQQNWKIPGRVIIATLAHGNTGFLVDEITAVMAMPNTGWGTLPALIPRNVFNRTLLLDKKMYLYTDFDKLDRLREPGCLRPYLQQLLTQQEKSSAREPPARAESTTYTPSITQPEHTLPTVPAVAASATPITTNTLKDITNPARFTTDERIKKTAKHSLATTDKRDDNNAPKRMPTPPATPSSNTASFGVSTSKPTITTVTLAHTATVVPANNMKNAALTENSVNRLPTDARSPLLDMDSGSPPVQARSWPERRNEVEFRVVQQAPKQHTDKITVAPSPLPPAKQQNTRVLFAVIVLALIGGMVSLFFILTTTTLSLSTNTHPTVVESTVVASQPSPDNSSITNKVIAPMPAIPATGIPAPYQANIQQNNRGITIVLSAPAQEQLFTTNEQPAVNARPAAPSSVATTSTKAPPTQTEITHIVVKGDTLWHIARRYVNNPFRYPELARLSNIKNPDLIYPGNRVRIIHRD